jgi:hypothetical protein
MKVHRSVPKKTTRKESILVLSSLFVTILVIGYAVFMKDWQSGTPTMNKHHAIKDGQASAGVDSSRITSEPGLEKARLQLESVDNVDKLTVILPGKDDDKEKTKYSYEWFINNEPTKYSTNTISGFKKGDKVSVKITPSEGDKVGQPKVLSVEIANVSPRVVENKSISFDGRLLSYQVKAVDPSGGFLSYSLVDAPKDMSIDSQSGVISWQVRPEDSGLYNMKVRISSNNGAETIYPLKLDIGKSTN